MVNFVSNVIVDGDVSEVCVFRGHWMLHYLKTPQQWSVVRIFSSTIHIWTLNIHTQVHTFICNAYTHTTYTFTHIHKYVCKYKHIYVMHTHILHTHTNIHTYIHKHIYTYVMHAHIDTHTHTDLCLYNEGTPAFASLP